MSFPRTSPDSRVIIVSGWGAKLTVQRGHVVIHDDHGERKLSRIDAKSADGIARIIVLAETGMVSFEVTRWCRRLGIGLYQLDRHGDLAMTSMGMSSDPRIRRAQILATQDGPYAALGAAITRELLQAKLAGQATNLSLLGHSELSMLSLPADLDKLIGMEGRYASTYWSTWRRSVFVPFRPEDLKLLPAHWYQFNGRNTGIKDGENRNATDPVNAMLNYAYAVCLTEAIYACHIIGLDPDFGFSHGTHDGKPGLALDLIEPLRPIADRIVLSMLDHGAGIPLGNDGRPAYLPADSFFETDDGVCRIYPPVTHDLAAKVSMAVAYEAGRFVESIVRKLIHVSGTTSIQSDTRPVTKDPRFKPREHPRPILSPDVSPSDLVPDHLWEKVKPLIPVRRSVQPEALDNRIILAGVIAAEIHGCAWSALPRELGVSRRTCKRHFDAWVSLGAWPAIRAEITKPGISIAV